MDVVHIEFYKIGIFYYYMKNLSAIVLISFVFSSFYQIGDTVNLTHQNIPLTICHGQNADSTIYIGDNIGKVTVLGIDATW